MRGPPLRSLRVGLAALALGAACAREEWLPPVYSRLSPVVPLDTGTVRVVAGADTFLLSVEIATRREQMEVGLKGRPTLPPGEGMLFLFGRPQAPDAGFYMYSTFVPLDVAFLDAEGTILAIREMEPCAGRRPRRCPRYSPGAPYRAALEVERGYFAARGVGPGDSALLRGAGGGRRPPP